MCVNHMRSYIPIPSVLNLCESDVLNDVYLGSPDMIKETRKVLYGPQVRIGFGVIVRRDGGQAFARGKEAR